VIPGAIDPEGLSRLLCVTKRLRHRAQMRLSNALTKSVSNLSRLGESNPRPTHYEMPGKPTRARYLH